MRAWQSARWNRQLSYPCRYAACFSTTAPRQLRTLLRQGIWKLPDSTLKLLNHDTRITHPEWTFPFASNEIRAKIRPVERIIGYRFRNHLLLWEAIQIQGAQPLSVADRPAPEGNKRLALLGDTILQMALLEDWYRDGQSRGNANSRISELVTNVSLERVGKLHNLDRYVARHQNGHNPMSTWMMATTVEAIIGAAYIDGGLLASRAVMYRFNLIYERTLLERLKFTVRRVRSGASWRELKATCKLFTTRLQNGIAIKWYAWRKRIRAGFAQARHRILLIQHSYRKSFRAMNRRSLRATPASQMVRKSFFGQVQRSKRKE